MGSVAQLMSRSSLICCSICENILKCARRLRLLRWFWCAAMSQHPQSFHQLATIHNWCYPTSWFAKLQSGHNSGRSQHSSDNSSNGGRCTNFCTIQRGNRMPYACHDAHKTRHSLCCELAVQFTERPTQVHWVAVKRILRYLDGRKDCGIYV